MKSGRGSSRFHISVAILLVVGCLSMTSAARDNGETRSNTDEASGRVDCNITSECVACTEEEKANEVACMKTGFWQPISCAKKNSQDSSDESGRETEGPAPPARKGRREAAAADGLGRKAGLNSKGKRVTRKKRQGRGLNEAHWDDEGAGEGRRFSSYQSCSPAPREILGVLGFEGIVLATLTVAAPVMYHRRKRNIANVGLTRVPSAHL